MATIKQEKLNKLAQEVKQAFKEAENELTREEFLDAIKDIVAFVKKIKQENVQEVATMKEISAKDSRRLAEKAAQSEQALKQEIKKSFEQAFSEQQGSLNFIRDKVSNFEKQKDKNEESLIREVMELIPEMPEIKSTTPVETRNKLETLKGEERLGWTAIHGLKEKLEELKEMKVGGKGGGGTSAMGVRYALGSTAVKETPTGDIDGANTTYTVGRTINLVVSFAINGQVITDDEYTVAGKTIEMTTAIPAALSGTSFRIVYV